MPVHVESMIESFTATSVRLRLLYHTRSAERFRAVQAFDSTGRPITLEQPPSCLSHWEVVTPPISQQLLPLTTAATGCDGAPDTPRSFNPPIHPLLTANPLGGGRPSCLVECDDNGACNTALAEGFRIQAEAEMVCAEWRAARGYADQRELESYIIGAAVAGLVLAIIILFGSGVWFLALIAAVLLVVAAALTITATILAEEARASRARQRALEGPLRRLRQEMADAIAAAEANCCASACGIVFPAMPC